MDTLLGCAFEASCFILSFLSHRVVGCGCVDFFVVISICGALKNHIEAMFGEIFGHT